MKTIVITFGRMNPPTTGHGLLLKKVKDIAGSNEHRIYLSQTHDPKKNPLTFEQKVKWMKKMFPDYNISSDLQIRTLIDALAKLLDEGFNEVIVVVGSDRVSEMERLVNMSVHHPDPDKRIWLTKASVVSAGERDPDAEDVTGMSASKLRGFVVNNDFEHFVQGVPKTLNEKEAFELYNEIKAGMNQPKVVRAKPSSVANVSENVRHAEKNLHLEHLEDQIINFGIEGGQEAIAFLDSLEKMLKGNSTASFNVTVKWDGAPAIVCGINPENKKFFVGTKAVFAKDAKINYTEKDILEHHGYGSGLSHTLIKALKYLPELGIKNVIQGDVMFTDQTLKRLTIEGKNYITFKPNTILYAVEADSDLAKKITKAKFGIVFHTVYSGNKMEQMRSSFNFDLKSLRSTPNVWASDAYFQDRSGQATFSKQETQKYQTLVTDAKTELRKINKAFVENYIMKNKKLQGIFKLFMNAKIKEGKSIDNPTAFAKDFIEFVGARIDKEIADLKTIVGQEKKEKEKQAVLQDLQTNLAQLSGLFAFIKSVIEAKLFVIRKLQAVKSIGTFIQTEDGFKVTAPEGFVAVDTMTNNAVKLVDRLEFSHSNFTAKKDWVKGS